MTVRTSTTDTGQGLVAVSGEVDRATAEVLGRAVRQTLEGSRQATVVDLSGVTFIDASGLTELVVAARDAASVGIELRIVATSRAVRRPIELTGLDRLFMLYEDVPEAQLGNTRRGP